VTPTGAQSGAVAGVGIQFNDSPDGEAARSRIEAVLGAMLNSDKPTLTM
jgi:type IV pilus assembly protein PilZ